MSTATNSALGLIRLAGDLAGNNNGLAPELTATSVTPGSYSLPSLTVDSKGRITSAANLTAQDFASIIPKASADTPGLARVGDGLNVASGLLSLKPATSTELGGVKVQGTGGLTVDSNGTLSFDAGVLPIATTTTNGVFRVGTGLTISSGVLSTAALPVATPTVTGTVRIGAGINVDGAGSISLAKATGSTYGIVRPGFGVTVDSAGVLSIDTTALATSTTGGLVKLGTNIVRQGDRINVVIPVASPSTLGLIRVGGGLSIDGSGILSAPGAVAPSIATTTSAGIVQIGSNVNVTTEGVISIPNASSTTFGAVRVNNSSESGLIVTNGELQARRATSTQFGIVRSSDQTNIQIVDGFISVGSGVVRKNAPTTFTAAVTSQLLDLGNSSGNVTLDLGARNVFALTMTGNITINTLFNVSPGGVYHVILRQDSVGGRTVGFPVAFKFNRAPDISFNPLGVTVLSLLVVSSNMILCETSGGF